MTILTLFKKICIIEGLKLKTYEAILKDNFIDKQTKKKVFWNPLKLIATYNVSCL